MPGHIRFPVLWRAGLAMFFGLGLGLARAQTPPLAEGPGRDTVEAACAVCHSLSYVQMNAKFLGPDVWKAEVAKMRGVFGAPIDDTAAAEIVAYLVARYGVAKP